MRGMRYSNGFRLVLALFCLQSFVVPTASWAERKKEKEPLRVVPPERWDEETEKLFRGDPTERLQGSREPRSRSETGVVISSGQSETGRADTGRVAWEEFISATVLEDEIKSIYPQMAQHLARIGAFKSGGYKEVEKQFAEVAVLFGILAEHPEAERWAAGDAAAARDHFAAASRNARDPTAQGFRAAKNRHEDLGQLIRGESLDLGTATSTLWSNVADRRALMQRLDQATTGGLKKWSVDQEAMVKNRSAIIHESQIVAALARVITLPEYDYHDDDEFVTYSDKLTEGAKGLQQGATEGDLSKIHFNLGEIQKTCSRCHEEYK